jgi:hypothetical protein
MECNECNGDQLHVGGRRRGDDSFHEKKVTFRFNACAIRTQMRGVGNLKDFEIRGVLEKEPRPAGHTSYQADRHGYLPEVKIESSTHMPNRVNNGSARSAGTKKSGLKQ